MAGKRSKEERKVLNTYSMIRNIDIGLHHYGNVIRKPMFSILFHKWDASRCAFSTQGVAIHGRKNL
jgi:hypothetical protein